MTQRRNSNCRHCGRHKDDVGQISWSGSCVECATERLTGTVMSIHAGEGEAYDRWLKNTRSAILKLK